MSDVGAIPTLTALTARHPCVCPAQNPREKRAQGRGIYARAWGAHYNIVEGFAYSAVAIIVAHLLKAPSDLVTGYALVYLASRLVFLFAYLANLSLLRSQAYYVGTMSLVALYLLSFSVNGSAIIDGYFQPVARQVAPLAKSLRSLVGA